MNRAQYERGALLVITSEHRETILELEPDLLSGVYREAQRVARGMVEAFGAVGVNVFHNSGVRANADEQEIRQLVSTWMQATKVGDIDTVLGLMTDDAVFLVAGRPPMIGKEAFAESARAQKGESAPEFEGSSEIQEIQVAGDIAYMWTKLTVKVTPPGESKVITRAGHTLTVLRKHQGRWLLARDANMLTVVEDQASR